MPIDQCRAVNASGLMRQLIKQLTNMHMVFASTWTAGSLAMLKSRRKPTRSFIPCNPGFHKFLTCADHRSLVTQAVSKVPFCTFPGFFLRSRSFFEQV